MPCRSVITGMPPCSVRTCVSRMAPVTSVGSPDTSVSPIPIRSPVTKVIDVSPVGASPLLVMPARVIPIVVHVIELIDQVLMPIGNRSVLARIPAFSRSALSWPSSLAGIQTGEPFTSATLARTCATLTRLQAWESLTCAALTWSRYCRPRASSTWPT